MTDWDVLSDKMEKLEVEEKKNEKNWNNLPDEMKKKIIKRMTFETRAQLKMCSKADKKLVESVLITGMYLELRAVPGCFIDPYLEYGYDLWEITLEIWSKFDNLSLEIGMNEDVIYIKRTTKHKNGVPQWSNNDKQIPCSNMEDDKKFVENIIKSIIFDGNYRFNYLTVFIDYPGFLDNIDFTIHAKEVVINDLNKQTLGLLRKLAPRVQYFRACTGRGKCCFLENFGTIPAVVNAARLETDNDCDINDEQLLNFKCTHLRVSGSSNITGKGMNQLIKKALANDYPIKTRFLIRIKYKYVLNDIWKEICEGLNVEGVGSTDYPIVEFGRGQRERRHGTIRMGKNKQMTIAVDPCHNYSCFKAEIIAKS